ncbi:MAG: hypothetical protein Q4F75_07770 [Pseudomonadota bacterium]|nr:hypothetical protein [Pseudomonadota bacterium]
MSLNMTIDEWKAGIPQRELERKIREYEENLPEREKMTAQARENNQTRFFLEDRFYELHKKELTDMMKKQAEENMKVCFRDGYSGIVPTMNGYSEGANVGFTPLPVSPRGEEGLDSASSRGGQNGLINFGTENQGGIPVTKGSLGDYASPAGGGLEASALTPPSYGASASNGSRQLASGYGNGYAADYAQPVAAAGVNPLPEVRNTAMPQPEPVQNSTDVSWEDYLKYATAAALQGYTLGFSDELYGLGGALGAGLASWRAGQNVWDGMKNGYVENRDDARAYLNEARERAPVVSAIAETGAGLVNPLGRVLGVGQKASRTAKIYNNMLENTVTGAVYGAGQGEGDFMNQLASTERGAALGMATGYILKGADRILPMYTGPLYRIPAATFPISLGTNWGYDYVANNVLPAAGDMARPLFQDKNNQ